MRVMYKSYANNTVVREVSIAYTIGKSELVCDDLVFKFENAMPYQNRSVDDLLMMLLREGFLDLRSLRLIVK